MPALADEHKLIRDRDRATRAKLLTEDQLFQEAFESYEADLMKAWRETGTAPEETHKRERLWLAINLLGKVREHLEIIMQNGKLAAEELRLIEEQKK